MGEFSCEGQGKLWSSIRDYFGVETELRKNIGEEKLGHSFGVNVFCAGAINYPFVRPWSTTTMTESCPWELGSPVMRSTDMEEKEIGFSTAKGESLGTVGWVFTLAAWQSAHPVMNLRRKVDIPGHQ